MFDRFLYFIISLWLLTACNDDIGIDTDGNMVKTTLSVYAGEMKTDGAGRGLVGIYLPDGSSIGVTALDTDNGNIYNSYNNIKYTVSGDGGSQNWDSSIPVTVGNTSCDFYAYYPYNGSVTDLSSIPITLDSGIDYLVSSYPATGISNDNPSVNLNMKHALACIKLVINKNSYSGDGVVSDCTLEGNLHSKGKLNAFTGVLSDFDAIAPVTFSDSKTITTDGAAYEFLVIPDGETHSIKGVFDVDGIKYSIPSTNMTLVQGKMYTLTVTINGLTASVNNVEIDKWLYESMSPQTDYVLPNLKITGDTENIAINVEIVDDGSVVIQAMPTLSVYKVNNVTMTTDGTTKMSQYMNANTGAISITLTQLNAPTTLTFTGTSVHDDVVSATYTVPSTRATQSVNVLSSDAGFDISKVEKMFVDGKYVQTSKTMDLSEGTHTILYKLSESMIPDHMFHGVTALSGYSYSSNINAVGNYSFAGCSGLTGVLTIPNKIISIGDYAYMGCSGIEGTITIHAGITDLGNGAFKDCTSVTEANVLCMMLSDELFENCTSLNSYTLADAITQISNKAFSGCTSLTSIEIPSTIETIGDYAFNGCTGLNDITCKKMTAPAISSNSFRNVSDTGILNITEGATGFDGWISNMDGYLNSDGWSLNEISAYYTIDLNNQWRSSSVANPDNTLYDGVYESYSNYNVNSSNAYMYIKVYGYETFTIYIRSYAESSYDYVMASALDVDITGSSSNTDTSIVAGHTRSKQNSSTAISGYQKITYTLPNKTTEYTIKLVYRKDGSGNSGTDRGYLLIEKQ